MDFLCETALLTHGLASISQADLAAAWEPARDAALAWVDAGKVVCGRMIDYLPFRQRAAELVRIDCNTLDDALENGTSGALTASGTMAVCARMGVPLAVTCGMGGIGDVTGEELCPDLPALAQIPVALIATSPKDMLDRRATIDWLLDHGVHVAGPACTGYVFVGEAIELEQTSVAGDDVGELVHGGGLLMLNPIPENRRIRDSAILEAAIAAGHRAERVGCYYHPAANAEIDRLTDGYSSRIQLDSLIANVLTAAEL